MVVGLSMPRKATNALIKALDEVGHGTTAQHELSGNKRNGCPDR